VLHDNRARLRTEAGRGESGRAEAGSSNETALT
jgi:hypothetical protein